MDDSTLSKTHKTTRRLPRPVSPIANLASNWSVTKATKRKATTEDEPPLKRQRDGKGTDANTNPGPSTLESVIEDKSSSDESTVLSGHTSREMVGRPISPIAILASNWSVTKATKRKATTGNEPPLKRQRGGKGTDANTNPGPSTLESVIEDKSSSDESTVLSGHTSIVGS
ncbi:uncharacterized protein LOC118115169 [Hippoglossus stenolepis]|uniref:uncharacterized protein LOC118115169 n=1 Tax=Hippoglossus stenolepis TaxID=195615 RepID=UPI001FAEA099|nr:uncharacterized protein LOC118115169 [Hippoglossus stenolepis]